VQALLFLAVVWYALRREIPSLHLLPRRWDGGLFREMFSYSMNFQLISLCAIGFDPMTKAIITRFGGLEMTGYYEMASRMVVQLRTVPVAASQALVPAVADLKERDPGAIASLYRDSYNAILYISLPYFGALAALAPLISVLWIGQYVPVFAGFTLVLSAAWFINTIISPAYMSYMGTGRMLWNTLGHALITVLNLALGIGVGLWGASYYIAHAWAFSLATGSLLIMVAYHRENGIPLAAALPRESWGLALASLTGAAVLYSALTRWPGSLMVQVLAGPAFAMIVGVPLWRHPMRLRLSGIAQRHLGARSGAAQ